MTEVIMPKMGDGMEEGTLLEWLKKDGEKVKADEVIGNIQTDKATIELPSPNDPQLIPSIQRFLDLYVMHSLK